MKFNVQVSVREGRKSDFPYGDYAVVYVLDNMTPLFVDITFVNFR